MSSERGESLVENAGTAYTVAVHFFLDAPTEREGPPPPRGEREGEPPSLRGPFRQALDPSPPGAAIAAREGEGGATPHDIHWVPTGNPLSKPKLFFKTPYQGVRVIVSAEVP